MNLIVSFLLFIILSFSLYSEIKKDPYFEFIYIDANSGQSSGGHSAIKFGDWVYHFQYYPDNIFHLVREPWYDFRYTYNILENRSLEVSKIFLEEKEVAFLDRGFNRLFLVQEKHLSNIKEMSHDVSIIESLLDPKKEYQVEGIGYISDKNQSLSSTRLREKIIQIHGINFLQSEINIIYQSVQDMNWNPNQIANDRVSNWDYPTGSPSLSSRYDPLMQRLAVLEAIQSGFGLDQNSLIRFPKNTIQSMTEDERKVLKNLQLDLEGRILSGISNPNSSYIELLQFLTYCLIDEMLLSNEFIFLDSFTEYRTRVTWEDPKNLDSLSTEILPLFQKYRSTHLRNKIDIQGFIDIQDSANRVIEVMRAKDGLRPIRHIHSKTVPLKKGLPQHSPRINWSRKLLYSYLEESRRIQKAYQDKIEKIYPYHLILKNCSSELFESIDKIYNYDSKKIKYTLGKQIDPNTSLAFIPFYAIWDIQKNYKNTKSNIFLSYRKLKLDQYKNQENPIIVDLRESFLPTSTIYEGNSEDHPFLFFTDDTILLRPFYGLGNLGTGIVYTMYGVAHLPFDNGKRFKKGIQSMFFSLPELVFFNIRKGSFFKIKPGDLDPEFPNENEDKK